MHYCSQEKETVGLVFRRELVHYCSHEKGTVRILSTVLKRTCALLFSGEGNRWSIDLKRTGGLLFQEKKNTGLLF